MPSEISAPFRLDGAGRVVTTTDPDSQVRAHALALLNTHPAERVMEPGYGVDLTSFLFEMETEEGDELPALITTAITSAFERWEPGIAITDVTRAGDNDGGETKNVNIGFARKDAADSGVVANANQAVIGVGGVIREIVRG